MYFRVKSSNLTLTGRLIAILKSLEGKRVERKEKANNRGTVEESYEFG